MLRKAYTIFRQCIRDHALQHVAALAYTSLFSIAPMLLMTLAFISLGVGHKAAEGKLIEQIHYFIGQDMAATIEQIIRKSSFGKKDWIAAIIGTLLFSFGSTAIFAQLKRILNLVWSVAPDPAKHNWRYFVKTRLLSLGLVAILGLLFLTAFLAGSFINTFADSLSIRLLVSKKTIHGTSFLITFSTMMLFFTTVLRLLPDIRMRWIDALLGATITSVLFLAGRTFLLSIIEYAVLSKIYGIPSSMMVLLVWIYYSALVIFIGAVLTRAYIETKKRPIRLGKYGMWMKRTFSKDNTSHLPKAS